MKIHYANYLQYINIFSNARNDKEKRQLKWMLLSTGQKGIHSKFLWRANIILKAVKSKKKYLLHQARIGWRLQGDKMGILLLFTLQIQQWYPGLFPEDI